jgi:hypothetical protein
MKTITLWGPALAFWVLSASPARAQDTFDDLARKIHQGQIVVVTDQQGGRTRGRVESVSATALVVKLWSASDVRAAGRPPDNEAGPRVGRRDQGRGGGPDSRVTRGRPRLRRLRARRDGRARPRRRRRDRRRDRRAVGPKDCVSRQQSAGPGFRRADRESGPARLGRIASLLKLALSSHAAVAAVPRASFHRLAVAVAAGSHVVEPGTGSTGVE